MTSLEPNIEYHDDYNVHNLTVHKTVMSFSEYLRMLEIVKWYEGLDMTVDDYLQLRQDLRNNDVPFDNVELERTLKYLGISLPT